MKISGDVKKVERCVTGFYSFDHAFENSQNEVGFPLRSMLALYGKTNIGKSTIAWTLAAKVNKTGTIAVADLEGFDPGYMETVMTHAGFDGEVVLVQDEDDEKVLDKLNDIVYHGATVGILDSVGAISPVSEREGDLGDANMGKRAKLMAQFSRKATYTIRTATEPKLIITTNHIHPIMAMGYGGVSTPGGEAQKFLAAVRVRLLKTEEETDEGYLITGKIDKNRYGYKNKEFQLYYVNGWGIHPGFTALYDCIHLKLAEKTRTVKLGDKSYGYVSKLFEYVDDAEFWQPFIGALNEFRTKGD